MDRSLLERIDGFPYRHRVSDLARRDLVALPAGESLAQATRAMRQAEVSSVLLLDEAGRAQGILTERDLVRLVAEGGSTALDRTLGETATRPVVTVPADAFLYVALGRMDRLGVRHLVVTDPEGRATGVLTVRAFLKTRTSAFLRLGDGIAAAADAPALRALHGALPGVAAELLAEGLTAGEVAEVISGVNRDLAARAVELSAAAVTTARGPAPAAWSYLVLGSAGRGESLLAPDQDNALVHAGDEERDDPWFAALGKRASDLLNQAGIPYCKGGVMASKPAWRHALSTWRSLVASWTAQPEAERLLAIDIFYDFVAVAGDQALAQQLNAAAVAAAAGQALPRLMAQQLQVSGPPVGLFGRFRTEDGRLDLKLHGLYPIVAGARVLALQQGVEARGTLARLAAARAVGVLNEADEQGLAEAFRLFQDLVLRQQIADLAAGLAASNKVAVTGLPRVRQRILKQAFERVGLLVETIRDAVVHG